MYGTMIRMFIPMFLSSLPQPFKGNPWLVNSTHQNFRTQIFHHQCDYMLKFQSSKKNTSILERTWPRNYMDAKNDPYQAPTLAYSKKMD
jgi:hypothetical protein